MVVKPGPRYYEIIFLSVAGVIALGLSRLRGGKLVTVGLLWIMVGSLQLGLNYFKPARQESQIDRTFYLWRFRDSSGDFVSKNPRLWEFAGACCRYSDLVIKDERLDLELKFLALGDWPPLDPGCGRCRLSDPPDSADINNS